MFLTFAKKKINLGHEQLAYIEYGEGKEVLVFIHGNVSSSLHFEPLIKELSKDYKIYAPDLRGFGDSSYNNRFDSIEELADDIIKFITKLNLKKVVLIGWSAGGAIAQVIAAEAPNLVRKLILIAPGSPKGYPVFKKGPNKEFLIGQIYTSKEELATDPLQVAPLLNILASNNVAMMSYIWDVTIYNVGNKPDAEASVQFLQESMKQKCLIDIDWALCKFNISKEPGFYGPGTGILSKIVAPVLILWGANDLSVNKYMFDEALRLLGSKTESVVYPNCGHSPIVDRPQQVADDIKSFIRKA